MKFMVIVLGSPETETAGMPSTEMLEEMNRYNQRLVEAGVMIDGDGLQPTSAGVRVRFEGDEPSVIEGPFNEEKLFAGYWIWECGSRDEAIEWLKQAPFEGGEVELRPFVTADDFGEALTPELRKSEEEMRRKLDQR